VTVRVTFWQCQLEVFGRWEFDNSRVFRLPNDLWVLRKRLILLLLFGGGPLIRHLAMWFPCGCIADWSFGFYVWLGELLEFGDDVLVGLGVDQIRRTPHINLLKHHVTDQATTWPQVILTTISRSHLRILTVIPRRIRTPITVFHIMLATVASRQEIFVVIFALSFFYRL